MTAFVALFFTGCISDDVASWDEQRCKEAGYKYEKKEVLNLRTGKYEIKTECIER
ncbi:hypothetical protein [Arcobacter sp. FWKO B]|uniref:hypothetical protein n=1 Tax=Arcobacter sp. FWKO B TaxID=2593672 RepID=UPI001905534C|nr:hypothetical protein [Arcobacter sp. FWKO B]